MDTFEEREMEYYIHPSLHAANDMGFIQGGNMIFSKEAFFGWELFSKGLSACGH